MLKGDLCDAALPAVLAQLAEGSASGCLHVEDLSGQVARVYLRTGRIYAAVVPTTRPQLGSRLMSSGSLGPEALAEALEAQRTELQGWRLGELLVHLGYVDQPVVEAFVQEQVREAMSDLLLWTQGTWRFRVNERTREDVAPPSEVARLLVEVERRRAAWQAVLDVVHDVDSIPTLSAAGGASDETAIDADAWALLCKVDGVRSIAELAQDCGFTMFEAGGVVADLVAAGLVEVEDPEPESLVHDALSAEPAAAQDVAHRLLDALQSAEPEPSVGAVSSTLIGHAQHPTGADYDDVEGSISRVSEALTSVLGPSSITRERIFDAPVKFTPSARRSSEAAAKAAKRADRKARDSARRMKDAEELMAAQAELEAAKRAHEEMVTAQREAAEASSHEAEIVDLQAHRDAAREEQERRAASDAEAARLAHEATLAAAAEAVRAQEAQDAERRLAEVELLVEEARLAEEAEAARLAEEALLLEQARLAEEQRLVDEIHAEAARLAEQERAALEAAWLAEQERQADQARAEQQRLDDEAEAARVAEQERAAAEAAWLAEQERQADQARAEQQRLDDEAEAARLAEQERAAAEAAWLAEQERQAAEAELVRAAEQEAQVALAAQATAELRLAQDAEQQRLTDSIAAAAAQQAARAEADRAAEEDRLHAAHQADAELAAFAKSELSAAASSAPSYYEGSVAVAEAPVEQDVAQQEDEHVPSWFDNDTDTASLLRELSSLGLEDDPAPAAPRAPTGPPKQVPAASKKRKGLFGR